MLHQCILEELEPVIVKDLDTLPQFITMWGKYASYFQNMYDIATVSTSNCCRIFIFIGRTLKTLTRARSSYTIISKCTNVKQKQFYSSTNIKDRHSRKHNFA